MVLVTISSAHSLSLGTHMHATYVLALSSRSAPQSHQTQISHLWPLPCPPSPTAPAASPLVPRHRFTHIPTPYPSLLSATWRCICVASRRPCLIPRCGRPSQVLLQSDRPAPLPPPTPHAVRYRASGPISPPPTPSFTHAR